MEIETKCLHEGYKPGNGEPLALPIYQSTTYTYDSTEHIGKLFDLTAPGHMYSRISNPTGAYVEEKLAALEGGVGCLLTTSGQAASFMSLFNILSAGDSFIAASKIYGGTVNLFAVTMKRMGIECIFIDEDADEETLQKAFKPNTRAVFAETLANPALSVCDIEKLARVAHANGVPLIIDNTFPTPIFCRPIEWGADIVIHSTTKYIDGHAIQVGGAIIDSGNFDWGNGKYPAFSEPTESYNGLKIWEVFGSDGPFGNIAFAIRTRAEGLRDLGPCLSPFNAFQLLQGLETLSLRVQRSVDNTLEIAQWLEKHPKVESVNYPGLKNSPHHALAKKYLRHGFGGVLSFRVKGNAEQTAQVINHLELISHLANVGDTKSLIIHPTSTTHAQLSEAEQRKAGVFPNLLRLSLGIEAVEDLKTDLDEALRTL